MNCEFSADDTAKYLPGTSYSEVALALEDFARASFGADGLAWAKTPQEQEISQLVALALRTARIDATTVENWLETARTAPGALADSVARGADQRNWWAGYLKQQGIDALIYATSPETASADWAGTAAAALSSHGGSPSVTVPLGAAKGLPVGLTILTQPGQDALALMLARRLEGQLKAGE